MTTEAQRLGFFKFEDPKRIGESIIGAITDDPEKDREALQNAMIVWTKVLELAGIPKPEYLMGWIPVFQTYLASSEDAAFAERANRLIVDLASLYGKAESEDESEPYWLDVDAMWERIQSEKNRA